MRCENAFCTCIRDTKKKKYKIRRIQIDYFEFKSLSALIGIWLHKQMD